MDLTKEHVASLVERFSDVNIWVVGDVMLDRYFWGNVYRISPEAPVPVVSVTRRDVRPGGAANVAANLCDLGIGVTMVGVVGDDPAADELHRILDGYKIDRSFLIVESGRQTTEKVRTIAQNQQVVRADFEADGPVSEQTITSFTRALIDGADKGDALVVSDYGKGVVQEDYLTQVIAHWRGKGKPVLVDPHIGHFKWYNKASIITPNTKEAMSFYGASMGNDVALERIGFEIKKALEVDALLITRGDEGMSLFYEEKSHLQIPTVAKEVYDVTGAGDTVISVMAACLSAGASLIDSVVIANHAAGETVKEVGTTTVTRDDLVKSYL